MMKNIDLRIGDCLEVLKEIEDNSIDSIVTDPPYGLNFMGKKWDYQVPSTEIWKECFRVLKPGGHLLSFAGGRTYHRIAINIEDGGFEIRDQIMWIYGSGFPKSHNIGKAVDKMEGNERKVVGIKENKINLNATKEGDKSFYDSAWHNKEYIDIEITQGSSDWEGWGTALKPAHEPIVMARKPLSEKTIVDNVLEWGTGGINIDGSRIGFRNEKVLYYETEGRFPANLIHDGSDEVINGFPETKSSGKYNKTGNWENTGDGKIRTWDIGYDKLNKYAGQEGNASRFFYCAKASKKDRNEGLEIFVDQDRTNYGGSHSDKGLIENNRNPENRQPNKNNHPTVKPTDLMLYLIRLVTPKGGITLDPFMGSGSSGKAAVRGGFEFVGIEREADYFEIAEARIEHEQKKPNQIKIFE